LTGDEAGGTNLSVSHYCDEEYDVYQERYRRARKPHVCVACKEQIPAGHVYSDVRRVWDGEADTLCRCLRCQTIHEHLRLRGGGAGMWPDEELNCGEEYEQHWGHEPPEEIAALAFITREEAQSRLTRLR
jgi:hypothetical protein